MELIQEQFKMTIKKIILLLSIFYYNTSINSQNIHSENTLGENYTIKSKILKEDRQIQIFIPESYEKTDEKFAVLYLLDGQRLFPFGVSLLKSFTQFKQTPEFIIVGITNKYPDRFGHFSDEEKKFLTFIEEDVISFVDNNFRTSNERLIFGWEYGGSFVIQTMIDRSDLFDAYLVASPFPLTNKISELDKFLSKKMIPDKMLYFSVSPNENQVNVGIKKLDSLLKLKASKTLNWTYKELENEEHRSTPYSTIYSGVKNFYQYYPELQFNNLEEFTNAGGLNYVNEYYKKRALEYGFSSKLSDWTMFSLTRNAIRANEYKQFNILVNEFEKTGFLERIRINRSCLIAEFYLANKQYDKSIEIFNLLAEKHPNAERPLKGLGDSYNALLDKRKASIYYGKAKKLSKSKSD
ncbi:alpha/beta hydrolase-fold protein [Lutimonas sp.]|uniref:alpha/beta hydrolase n=1 Tax=Lutimonas sp. TaxID=1872403 RepID=UPI003D9AE531